MLIHSKADQTGSGQPKIDFWLQKSIRQIRQ